MNISQIIRRSRSGGRSRIGFKDMSADNDRIALQEAPEVGLPLLDELMNRVPGLLFWIKDSNLRYVRVNEPMVGLCGANSAEDVVGRTAWDFFPASACAYYEAVDREVMGSRRPALDRLHLTPPAKGDALWLLYSRWPVISPTGVCTGVASLSRVLDIPKRRQAIYAKLKQTVDFIHASFGEPVSVRELARRTGLSVSQFERHFADLFGVSPGRYVRRLRFEAALKMLDEGGPVADVAHACGYSDQSAFTRSFRSAIGVSPVRYRRARQAAGRQPTGTARYKDQA